MGAKTSANIGDILKHPEVQKVTDNINQEVIERREYKPPVCKVFSSSYTILEDKPHFEFDVDNEAKRRLPGIIDNKVQTIVELQTPEEIFKEQSNKKRKIGIVFSGGPAPGGHNVIAGLYDAAQKANPGTIIYGFLLGPDGIIEGEAIEITGSLVDRFRNLGGFTMIKTGRAKIDTKEKMAL